MSNRFTILISESTKDFGDYGIHHKSEQKPEQLLVHMKFQNLPMLDESFLDGIVGEVAKKLGNRILEHKVCGSENAEPDRKAVRTAKKIIKKLQEW
ncbi:hypothetical protein [Endozoicomonas arenosclerae]|uniref:hypothetical protein n=1 Tax=Endozoicomonas arenosclerae TaxID=1633495 RepID=UPI0007856775|nr:hypothetical protein [Endozoicomonas arenosclerae]